MEPYKRPHKLLQLYNRSCTVASGMKTVGHVLSAEAIATAEDRLLNIMEEQYESLASISDFQNWGLKRSHQGLPAQGAI